MKYAMKGSISISCGGSMVAAGPTPEDPSALWSSVFLRQFRNLVVSQVKADRAPIAITVGGGQISRKLIATAKLVRPNLSADELDKLGIRGTVINADLVQAILEQYAYETVVTDPHLRIETKRPVIVCGGYKPGRSTDWCAVQRAITMGTKTVINVSNVAQVCDKDPRDHTDAKPLERLSWQEYRALIPPPEKWTPGLSTPFDPVASQLADENNITVFVVSGDPVNLRHLLEGGGFIGTIIEN